MKYRHLPFLLAALITFTGAVADGAGTDLPFHPGERLTFRVRWAFFPAGEAVLEILPQETVNGIRAYHFSMSSKTYEFIDLFYKVRDRIDAYTDEKVTRSILYKKRQEGKSKRDIAVTFDWEKREAQYSNFGEKGAPIAILPGSLDPLSVFYAFRLSPLAEGAEIKVPVTDGKKSVMGKAQVIKREKIKVGEVLYDTYLVEPDLEHVGGVFEKSREAKVRIWVTADERRIPVRFESEVVVGSFIAELIAFETKKPDQVS
ncbi:MAG: DUF3108 domain-containing protein [Desulfobacterales bacterium]|nr:DUF3108 domain-containing protein [Desulfobacterales bacterium]